MTHYRTILKRLPKAGVLCTLCLTAFTLLALASPAGATTITLDDFKSSQSLSQGPNAGVQPPISNTIFGGGFIGASRTMTLSSNSTLNQSALMNTGAAMWNNVLTGFYNFETGASTTGLSRLIYDNSGAGFGSSLSTLESVEVHVLAFNLGTGGSSNLTLFLTDDKTTLSYNILLSTNINPPLGQLLSFPITGSGINLTKLQKVELMFNPGATTGADILIDRFTGTISRVPEPSSLVLLSCAGLLGFAWVSRRKDRSVN